VDAGAAADDWRAPRRRNRVSWRSDAGAKLAGYDPQATVATKHGHRGDHVISRKPCAGRRIDPPVPVVLPRAFCCTRTMGAVGTRPSLRLSSSERTNGSRNQLGRIAPRGHAATPIRSLTLRRTSEVRASQTVSALWRVLVQLGTIKR